MDREEKHHGIVTSVRGGVVDARFPFELPKVNNLLLADESGQIRGRVFNVFGEPIDRKGELTGCEFLSVHRKPVVLAERSSLSKR